LARRWRWHGEPIYERSVEGISEIAVRADEIIDPDFERNDVEEITNEMVRRYRFL